MSELPKGWKQVEIGDVSKVVSGGTPKASISENFCKPSDGGHAWLTPADLSGYKQKMISHGKRNITDKGLKESSAKLMPEGSILFSSRAPIGYVAIAENEIATNQGFKSFVFTDEVEPSYAYYYLKSIRDLAESWGTGTTFKELSSAKARKLPFIYPSIDEQKRIADKLDSVLAKVEAAQARLDKIPAILKRFRHSVLAAATSGELTKDWRKQNTTCQWNLEKLKETIYQNWLVEREKEFLRKGKHPKTKTWLSKFPKVEPQLLIDKNWVQLSLQNIAEVIDPNPSHRMPKYVADGIPFISSENILAIDKLNFEKGKKITLEEVEKQRTRYEIKSGTFAFTRIGTIGKSVLLPKTHDYGISHAMAVVNPYREVVDSTYLIWVMNCESILNQALHGVQSVGVPDLGIGKMKDFKIPLPPLEEQQEIVSKIHKFFEHANTVEIQYNSAKIRLDKLTQSILMKAFKGELLPSSVDSHIEAIENSVETLNA
ncbi:restriction endonuclease subunit S [Alteromonas sp. OM2203]|uniref:restriction endonuclease subunit S n=1 Tax=Alteromonas sp. OM2203 TaxID=3398817 RepID=UPI003AF342B0